MTSPNFPTPFMSSAVASKGRARHKACGKAGNIDQHPTGRDTFRGRPDDDPLDTGPNKLSESLIYFTSVQGTKHPSMKRPFPGFLEGQAASPILGGPEAPNSKRGPQT